MDITEATNARTDRYAKNVGPFVLGETIHRIDDARSVWDWVTSLGSRTFRVIYRCADGTVRDMLGRQGIYNSKQDGEMQGTGRAMRSATSLTLSFWTNVHGGKAVNTGAGKGYRTLRADRILAIRCQGIDILTKKGVEEIRANH